MGAGGMMAMLLAGTAQPVQVPPAEPAGQAAPPVMEFRDAEGNPLPADVQKQLREEFRKNPPPTTIVRRAPSDGDIVVTGQRPRGSVVGDIPPERVLGVRDVRAFGASNVSELLTALGAQVGSTRGRDDGGPVTLLNGRRVSDFSEIARIPTEAIERTEIFPEEVALKYGYRADQKVVNIVTFERFTSKVGQLNYSRPTEGGREGGGVVGDYFAITGDTRYNFGAEYARSGALLERERDVVQPVGTTDLGRFRTLLPQTERLVLSGLVSGTAIDGVSSTFNGRFEASGADSLLGRGASGVLRRKADTRTLQLGTTQSGRTGKWAWTLTGGYNRIAADIRTDVDGAAVRDTARSVNALAAVDLLLAGPVLDLPAGPLFASVRGGVDFRDFDATSRRGGVAQRTDLSRDRGTVQASVDLPITGGSAAPRFGRLSANANLELERLSDLGTLRTLGYGISWSPIPAVNLIASATHEEGAPTVEQLGAPLVVTPNVRTFDFTRGEVVDITRVSGGNAALRADDRHVARLGLNARPFGRTDVTVNIDYVRTRIDDPIAAFPIATPDIEAAFPNRFLRDAQGGLLQIDGRPLNFAASSQQQLRWGVNFTRPLAPVPPGMQGTGRTFASEAEARRAFPGAQIFRAEPGSPMARRAENMASRLFVSLYHTWTLEDRIRTRDGGPVLDLLDGDAVDFRGGRRRHEVEFQAGVFKRGLGARLTTNWQSGTHVRGLDDLRFDDLATVNLNLFANLAERFGGSAAPVWLKGTRVTLGIANLLNTRPQVRDAAGATPLSYQPAYLDPVGRSVFATLRKAF